jgi:hypothetical protein
VLNFPLVAVGAAGASVAKALSVAAGSPFAAATGTLSPVAAAKAVVSPPAYIGARVPTLLGFPPGGATGPLAPAPGIAAFGGAGGTLAAGAFGAVAKGAAVTLALEVGVDIGSAAGALGEAIAESLFPQSSGNCGCQ